MLFFTSMSASQQLFGIRRIDLLQLFLQQPNPFPLPSAPKP
jgi:hypothetical protein